MPNARHLLLASLVAAVAIGAGCGPSSVTFEGKTLKKARSFKIPNGVKGMVFTADGDEKSMEGAPQQLGVLYADTSKMATPEALQDYIMEVYSHSNVDSWLSDTPSSTTACKVGRDLGTGRFFVAVHVCASVGGNVACAEIDEAKPVPCHMDDRFCYQPAARTLCDGAIAKRKKALIGVLGDVVK